MGILEGKTALITGARRGIGRATVEVFASEGANIWACARREDDAFVKDMATIADNHDVQIKPLFFEMEDEAAMRTAVKEIRSSKVPLDIIVPVAGITANNSSFFMTSSESMREVYEVNLVSQFRLVQYLSRVLVNKGSIVTVSSIAATSGMSGQYSYACSKAAVEVWTKMLAEELASKEIRVNAVAPGFVDTDMGNGASEEVLYSFLNETFLRRMATPTEIAKVICMLASDYCSYVTGQVLRVDGGSRY